MHKEYDALINNGAWKLVHPPLETKSIFKNKYKEDESLNKHKYRFMGKTFP